MSNVARLQFLKHSQQQQQQLLRSSLNLRLQHADNVQTWWYPDHPQKRWKSTTTTGTAESSPPAAKKERWDSHNYIISPKARNRTFWPKEAETIADGSQLLVKPFEGKKPPPAAVREFGNVRRIIMLQPHCQDAAQLKGLAYRIRALSKNTAINSMILNLTEEDNPNGWLSYVMDASERPPVEGEFMTIDWAGSKRLWSTGYDIQSMIDIIQANNQSNSTKQQAQTAKQQVIDMLTQLQQLGLSVRGDSQLTKIPFVAFCNGRIEDGGYALAVGSYLIATDAARFTIRHGFKGLSFDPLGFSFILPRLGWEYDQLSANYPAIGYMLALTGYQADERDMVETGLATHFMAGSVQDIMGYLEWALEHVPPFRRQMVVPDPVVSYGQTRTGDINFPFRNHALATTLYAITEYNASGYELPSYMDYKVDEQMKIEDASTNTDFTPCQEPRYSQLVDLADKLDNIFQQEDSVEGILERLRQVAASGKDDGEFDLEDYLPGDKPLDVPSFAATMVENMERQSPLSLCVMYRLMNLGARHGETLERCMDRELQAQINMYLGADFKTWAEYEVKRKQEEAVTKNTKRGRPGELAQTTVPKWQHGSVKDVTADEVEEIIFGNKS